MNLPDFLVVGAMKCGTTTLAAQLAAQDGIFLTDPKEPNFFSDDDVWVRGEDWYRGLFAEAGPDDLKGEASTHYTKLPTHPRTLERMQGLLAAPRLVYMIRNPVERVVSHYIHGWSEESMRGNLAEAVGAYPELVAYGRYGMQIAPFAAAYGVENIFLTSLEQLTAGPQKELDRIARFIGFTDTAAWHEAGERGNVSAERYRRMPFHHLLIDSWPARTLRRTLVPKGFRSWVRARRSLTRRPEMPADLRRRLECAFAEDREALARLFPDHPALEVAYPFLAPQRQAG